MVVSASKKMYRICEGVYPNHGQTLDFGRFISWQSAHDFLVSKGLNPENFTIIDGYEIPF